MFNFITDFYKKTELPLRLAYFWGSSNVCTVIASFLAFGILRMRGVQGKAGWSYVKFPSVSLHSHPTESTCTDGSF